MTMQRYEIDIPDELVWYTDTFAGRFYHTPQGIYPSITTVLGAGKDTSYLNYWRERVGDEAADKKTRESCSVGTEMHLLMEMFVLSKAVDSKDYSPRAWSFFQQMKKLLIDNVDMWVDIELALYSTELKIAGRCDFIGYNKTSNELVIVDYKSNHNLTRLKQDDEVEDYKIQITGYAKMFEERTGIPINNGIVLMTNGIANQKWAFKTDDYFDKLKERIGVYYGLH